MPVTINGTTGITNPDGSASTPSIAGSDSNTGVFFPAADTVGIATGGVERFRLASDGSQSSVVPSGSTLYPQFACRAWVNFNGTGTIAIRASGNITSITDNGTGDYTLNLTTALPDANFVGVIAGSSPVNVSQVVGFLGAPGTNDTTSHPSSSAFRFSYYITTNSANRGDPVMVNAAIFR